MLNQFCRICAGFFHEALLVPCYDDINITTIGNIEIRLCDIIILLNIKIKENDGLPQQLCINCLKHLVNTLNLFRLCKSSQNKLKRIFQHENNVNCNDKYTKNSKEEIFLRNTSENEKEFEDEEEIEVFLDDNDNLGYISDESTGQIVVKQTKNIVQYSSKVFKNKHKISQKDRNITTYSNEEMTLDSITIQSNNKDTIQYFDPLTMEYDSEIIERRLLVVPSYNAIDASFSFENNKHENLFCDENEELIKLEKMLENRLQRRKNTNSTTQAEDNTSWNDDLNEYRMMDDEEIDFNSNIEIEHEILEEEIESLSEKDKEIVFKKIWNDNIMNSKQRRIEMSTLDNEWDDENEDINIKALSNITKCLSCYKYGFKSRSSLDNKICNFNLSLKKFCGSQYCCFYCDEEFEGINLIEEHIMKSHSIKEPFLCKTCNMTFTNPLERKTHCDKEHILYRCDVCNKPYRLQCKVRVHKERTHPDGNLNECEICLQSFINAFKLRYHMKSHDPSKKLKCRYCDRTFMQAHHRRYHEETHTNTDKPYKCGECNKSYAHLDNFKIHIKLHQDATHLCDICGKGFSYGYLLNIHKKTIHLKPYICEYCGKNFGAKATLDIHSIIHKKGDERKSLVRKYSRENLYKKYQQQHRKKKYSNFFTCSKCSRKFLTAIGLKNHLKVHDKNRKYTCTLCNISYKTSSHLATHMNKHTKTRKYECKYCNKIHYDSSSRNFHERSHLAEKFKCKFCDKMLSARYLQTHERTHTNYGKFKCLICGEGFISSQLLAVHHTKHSEVETKIIEEQILMDNNFLNTTVDENNEPFNSELNVCD